MSTFSHTRENSKMFNITLKYFSFFNIKPPASWVAHITRNFLTWYSCSYCSSMILCNQFYWPPDNFFKKKILTLHAMKTHIEISYTIKKVNRKEGDVCKYKDCKWIRATLLLMPRYIDFSWMLFYIKCCTCNKCIFKLHLTY